MGNRLRLAVALAWSAWSGWAMDWTTLKPEGCVSDFARVLDSPTRARLEAYCAALGQATGARMALVTLPSLQGEPAADVAAILFRTWGVGKSDNQGVLLLLSIGDHLSRLEVGRGLQPILPGGAAARVLRQMRPALRQNDYGNALAAAAQTIGGSIARARHVTLSQRLPQRIRPGFSDAFFPWPVLVGGLLLLLWLMRAGAPRGYGGFAGAGLLPGLLLGSALGRATWGSNGSGGFGGYDSGDSFGGFGGDSGGPSSDW